jgi:hypothetical protein
MMNDAPRPLISILAAVFALPLLAVPAAADPDCGGIVRDCDYSAETSLSGVVMGARSVSPGGSAGTSWNAASQVRGEASACGYEPVSDAFDRDRDVVDQSGIPLEARFYRVVCGDTGYLRWYVPGESDPVEDGVITEIVQEAFDRIDARLPQLALTPGVDGVHITGLASWLAVDPAGWERIEGSVDAGGISVTAWLDPMETIWEVGDGASLVCEGPGSVYDPQVALAQQDDSCSHTFAAVAGSGGWEVTARVVYAAGYEVMGVPGLEGVYELGAVDGPSTTVELDVREYRAVRVGP